MNELIKIASNGQWTLEKAKTNEDQQRMIEEFLAQKKAELEQRRAQAKAAPAPQANPLEGLQPVSHQTGENPDLTREEVMRRRQHLTSAEAAQEAAAQKRRAEMAAKNRPDPIVSNAPHQPSPRAQAAFATAVNPQNDAGTAADIEAAKRAQQRKAAWQATTEFLANQGGNRGMRAIAEAGQQRAELDRRKNNLEVGIKPVVQPKMKQELQPPQEAYVDEKTGVRGMRDRQGTFHNEGATTTGKIVDTHQFIKQKDPVTGEEKMMRVPRPQVQKHIWAWDHNAKKWNHVKTELRNPDPTKG